MRIYGIDFTSAPCKRKPITVAVGDARENCLQVTDIERLADFSQFEAFLRRPGPWVGGFDFPFGLARQALVDLSWPMLWEEMLLHCRRLGRVEFKRVLDLYRESRPKGQRYAKRRGDDASGAHPSVKLVNPPVGFMFLEGATRLAAAALHIPGLKAADDDRVALEAYPGLLVSKQLGIRKSYKSDTAKEQTAARKAVRQRIVDELKTGRPLGIRLNASAKLEREMVDEGAGDLLDAVICAVQASWGWLRRDCNYGLPPAIDAVEGWIVSA